MSQNDNFKPSLSLDSFFGTEFAEDNERFLLFLKAYYEWLQTTRIEVVNQTGTFQRDETIVGATSKATGIVREVQDGAVIIQYTTKKVFSKSETITGQTSGATATLYSVKDNVVRASGNVVDYRTLDNSIDKYFEYLRDELYTSLPVDFYGNKRLVATKFRDFFSSKSSEQSYRFLFKLLYNESVEFYYPGEDILRVSDGKYERTQVIRVTSDAYGTNALGETYSRNVFEFLNKTIRGSSSGALAFVVDIKKFFIGSIETAEMTLRLVSADFEGGETITDIEDNNLNATVYGIVAGFDIVDGGSGYEVGDTISISGDGAQASAIVSSIKQSPITALTVNAIGHGYQLGTDATISNTGAGGSGLIVRVTDITNTYSYIDANTGTTYTLGEISEVSVISRGSGYYASPVITLQDTDIEPLGLLSDKLITIDNAGESYTVGDDLVFTGGSGANAAGIVASVTANSDFSNNLVFEDGFSLLFEQSYDDVLKTEDWDLGAIGPIRRIELTNFGDGYTTEDLPTVTVDTLTGANVEFTVTGIQGSSADVVVDTANNATGVGSIRAVQMFNFGIDYSTATADATGSGDGNANLIPIISGIGVKEGTWLDDDGKIDYKILQDSYYFQDYSYVIKSGLTVETYIDTIKKSIHPAGLQVFGELLLLDILDVSSVWKSSVETIKDFIVRIYDFITVAPVFGEFDITIETTIESFTALQVALIPDTDIASHEYVIHAVPGGNDTINVPYVFNEPEREIVVRVERDFNAEMEVEVAPIRKMYVSTTDTQQGYTIGASGGLGEEYIEEYETDPISLLADEIFGGLPSSLSELGSRTIFLVRGGDDINRVENIELTLPRDTSYTYLVLQSFFDNAVSIIYNDVTFAETGTDEIVIDKITFVNAEIEMHREVVAFLHSTVEDAVTMQGEYVLDVYAKGSTPTTWVSAILDDHDDQLISELADIHFEVPYGSAESLEIFVSPSPLAIGQAARGPEPTDVFRTVYKFEINPYLNMSVRSDQLLISAQSDTVEYNREIPILINVNLETHFIAEYVVPIESLGFANADFTMIIAFSSVVPQKLQTAESLTSAYGIQYRNVSIATISNETFADLTGEAAYQGISTTHGQATFNTFYRTYPLTFTEMVMKVITIEDNSSVPVLDREIVVNLEGNGFKVDIYGDALISDYASDAISTLQNVSLEEKIGESYDVTIKASPSPFASGQSVSKQPTDVFRGEYVVKHQNNPDAYDTSYGDVKVSTLQALTFEDVIPGTLDVAGDQIFSAPYPQAPETNGTYIKYEQIAGTVSSDSIAYSDLQLDVYSELPMSNFEYNSMTGSAQIVVGVGTDFVTDFDIYDPFVANNEYFTVEAIANTTYMTVDRAPSSPYSGISAYKQVN